MTGLVARIRARAARRQLARDAQVIGALYLTNRPMTGGDLWRTTGLGPGLVYVSLARLERSGMVTSDWEILPPGEQRARRRYYRLSGATS